MAIRVGTLLRPAQPSAKRAKTPRSGIVSILPIQLRKPATMWREEPNGAAKANSSCGSHGRMSVVTVAKKMRVAPMRRDLREALEGPLEDLPEIGRAMLGRGLAMVNRCESNPSQSVIGPDKDYVSFALQLREVFGGQRVER